MVIRTNTADRLVLRDPNRYVAGAVVLIIALLWLVLGVPAATEQNGWITGAIAAVATIIPLIFGLLLLSAGQVVFDADTRMAQIQRGFFSKNATWQVPFDEIDALYLGRSSDPDGGPPGFLLYLGTTKGDVQMSLAVYDRTTADAALDAAADLLTAAGVNVNRIQRPRTWPGMQERPAVA